MSATPTTGSSSRSVSGRRCGGSLDRSMTTRREASEDVTWFKVDDKLHDHRKARRAGKAAMGVWALAGSWAADNLTDGFVPVSVLSRWGTRRDAAQLVAAGLWAPADRDGEPGWQFHEWRLYQPMRAEVEADREAARERMRRARQAKRSPRSSPGVRPNVRQKFDGSSDNPVPSRPDSGSVVSRRPTEPRTKPDDDEDTQLAKIAAATGGDRRHAAKVRADVLGRANGRVNEPLAYVLRAIGDDPSRYRATPIPRRHVAGRCDCPDCQGTS